jgi:hypothetical protein
MKKEIINGIVGKRKKRNKKKEGGEKKGEVRNWMDGLR